jgi:hypothetical protein
MVMGRRSSEYQDAGVLALVTTDAAHTAHSFISEEKVTRVTTRGKYMNVQQCVQKYERRELNEIL